MTFYNNILYVVFSYFCDSTMAISENLQNLSSSTFSSRSVNLLPDHLLIYLILVNLIVLVTMAYIFRGRGQLPSSSNSQLQPKTHPSTSPSNISTRNSTGLDFTPTSRKSYRKFNSPSFKIKSSTTLKKVNQLEKLIKLNQIDVNRKCNQILQKLIYKPPPPPSCSDSEDEILKQELINLCNPYYRPSSEGETPKQCQRKVHFTDKNSEAYLHPLNSTTGLQPHLPSNQLQSKTTKNPLDNLTFTQPPSQPYLHSSQHQDYFSCTQLNNQKF